MNPNDPVVAPARLHQGGDGDTFDLLVNFYRKKSWRGAQVVNVRLSGWRAQENEGKERDTPETDAQGNVVRLSGRQAAVVTTETLRVARGLRVAFMGIVSLGREVCEVWIDEEGRGYVPLGEVLAEVKVVTRGTTMGAHRE